MKIFPQALSLSAISLVLVSGYAHASVKPSALFNDNMVLQQGIAVPLWGTAAPMETVTVSIAGQTVTTKAEADGQWRVKLAPLKAGGPFDLKLNDLTLKNVLVGEVWLASGQSNMGWSVEKSQNATEEIANANFPEIRVFTLRGTAVAEPQTQTGGKWDVCSPQTVGKYSAAAFFFARELQQTLKVPVGIIHSSRGGTPAEAWTSRSALESQPALKGRLDLWDKRVAD